MMANDWYFGSEPPPADAKEGSVWVVTPGPTMKFVTPTPEVRLRAVHLTKTKQFKPGETTETLEVCIEYEDAA